MYYMHSMHVSADYLRDMQNVFEYVVIRIFTFKYAAWGYFPPINYITVDQTNISIYLYYLIFLNRIT